MPDGFDYFDGREWAAHEVREDEMGGVEVDISSHETRLGSTGGGARASDAASSFSVHPPKRVLYPRPVESVGEARALYCGGEITIDAFEQYVEEALLDGDRYEFAPVAP